MMSETRKFMPNIANYLSDSDREIEDNVDNTVIIPQVHSNYAEWKRLKNTSGNSQAVRRSVNRPLADISSCEEDYSVDDNAPIYKIVNHLADKEEHRRRNNNLSTKSKDPSHFLLFSRMKQRIHFDCSFSDLCQITHASWANMDASENEELIADIDRQIRDYKESILKFRQVLLPDYISPIKTTKPPITTIAPIIVPSPPDKDQSPITLTLSTMDDPIVPETDAVIPERLQNLAGDASVYFAPDKTNRLNSHHQIKSTKRRNVTQEKNSQNCNFPDCENVPIDDYRWDGQYCSAKCLIKDCQITFNGWLTEQTNGNEVDQEIILCLESSSDNEAATDNQLSEAPEIIKRFTNGRETRSQLNVIRSTKWHNLIENSSDSESDDLGTFHDTQAGDFVT